MNVQAGIRDLQSLGRALGGEVSGRQISCPGPGHSPRDRSLSVRLSTTAPDGFICHSHAGDDWQTCRDYVLSRLGFPTWRPGDEQSRRIHSSRLREFDRMAMDRETEQRPRTEDDLIRIKHAQALWNEALDPRGTVAVQYLKARALDLPDDLAGGVLRFHPRCPWRNEDSGKTERIPALLAAFRSIDSDDITAVHRIRVDQPQRWPKADRRMLGLVHRAAVKLDTVATTLMIGEGIETCMAARRYMAAGDIEHAPVWAVGSVGAISFFPVLEGVKGLIILGESGQASGQAIQLCGRRWQHAGRRVQVIYSEMGSDVNDALMIEKIAQ
jgi:putative DNA primase/helicase